jgi:cyd operon protein YbgT
MRGKITTEHVRRELAFAVLTRKGTRAMWYFTWILGLGAALAFGIINVMWLEASYTFGELDEDRSASDSKKPPKDASA